MFDIFVKGLPDYWNSWIITQPTNWLIIAALINYTNCVSAMNIRQNSTVGLDSYEVVTDSDTY